MNIDAMISSFNVQDVIIGLNGANVQQSKPLSTVSRLEKQMKTLSLWQALGQKKDVPSVPKLLHNSIFFGFDTQFQALQREEVFISEIIL